MMLPYFKWQEGRGGYTMVRNDEHSLISILLFLYLDKQDVFLFFNLEVFINSAFYFLLNCMLNASWL